MAVLAPERASKRRDRLAQFAAVRRYIGLSFSPDGAQVAYVNNVSGQLNVWRQPVHPSDVGGPLMPVQLTTLMEDVARTVAWSPDGTTILTTVDHAGDENYQINEIPAENGWPSPLTNQPHSRHEMPERPYSPDGRFILYGTNSRNPADFDAVIRDLGTGAITEVMAGDANYLPGSWSPDGGKVLVVHLHSNTDQDLYLCEVRSGDRRHLTPHEGENVFIPGPWSTDGKGFYLRTNQGREFTGLAFFDLDSNRIRWLETPDWDIQEVDLSHDGRYLAWTVNEDGYSKLYVRDTQTRTVRDYPNLPAGVYTSLSFSPTEPVIGLYISRAVAPADLWMLNVDTGRCWRLTRSFLGGVPEDEMVEPELIRYPSFDDHLIPAFLYKPRTASGEHRSPVVLSIHGGPEAQEQPTYNYSGLYQHLLDQGIGVIATNIRGSSGYGASYQKLIHRDFGGGELKDLECAAKYLRTVEWVDSDRLGVFGGSFGGFATLSCMTRLPEYWAAGVDIVGPSNLVTFARSVPEFWKRMMRDWVGDPDEDADMLRERSPITHVDNVRAPLLVLQGANDPRVVKAESDQMVQRLRDRGQTVEYLVFEDEGHGFTKVDNVMRAYRATVDWFERYLLDDH